MVTAAELLQNWPWKPALLLCLTHISTHSREEYCMIDLSSRLMETSVSDGTEGLEQAFKAFGKT